MTDNQDTFANSMTVSVLGLSVSIFDLIRGGTIVLGLCGALFAVLGGWEAWRAKRLEHKLRSLELKRLEDRDTSRG